jgi:hypothetical protein
VPGRVGRQRADGRAHARTQRLAAGGRSRGHADAPPPRHVRQRLCGELCRWVFVEGLLLEITSGWVTDFRPRAPIASEPLPYRRSIDGLRAATALPCRPCSLHAR